MKLFTHLLTGALIIALSGCSGLRPKPVYTGQPRTPVDSGPVVEHQEEPKSDEVETVVANRRSDTNINREKMMSEIEDLLGVPYKYGGNSRFGLDCSGFVQTVFEKAISLPLPRTAKDMFDSGHSVSKDELNFGDLVFFKDIEDIDASHVGIYLDSGNFAHASVSEGVIISDLSESYYSQRYAGARRVVFE